jgi:tetratricopeptide (TPR) repeat protein
MQALKIDEADARWGDYRYWSAVVLGQTAQRDEARRVAEELCSMARQRNWRPILADVSRFLAYLEREVGQLEYASQLIAEALRIHRELGDLHGQARDLSASSEIAFFSGALDEADALAAEAAVLYERDNRRVGLAACLRSRGNARLQRGDLESAGVFLRQALESSRQVGNQKGVAVCLSDLGELARAAGDLAEAERCYRDSLAKFRSLGLTDAIIPLANLALNLLRADRLEEGASHLRAAYLEAEQIGSRALLAILQPALMFCAAREGDWTAWDRHYAEAAKPIAQIETDTAWFAEEAGRVAASAGEHPRARAAWELALRHWQQLRKADRVAAVQAVLKGT